MEVLVVMKKRLFLVVLVVVMLTVTGCNLFKTQSFLTSFKLTLKDGTPITGLEIDFMESNKKITSGKTDASGIAKVYLRAGSYQAQAKLGRDVGGEVSISQAIKITKDKETIEIKVNNTGCLDIVVNDASNNLTPNSKVQILNAVGTLIKEFDAKTGKVVLLVESGKTYKIEATVGEFSTSAPVSVVAEEKLKTVVTRIPVSSFVGTVTTTGGVKIANATVKVGKFSGTTDADGKFTIMQDKEVSDVIVEWEELTETFPNVTLTTSQNLQFKYGLIDTVLNTNITLTAGDKVIVLEPDASDVIKKKIPNGTYKVTIELPYYKHEKEGFVVDGQNLELARSFRTIEEFGSVKAGTMAAENGIFKATALVANYAIIASTKKYVDATFYVEVHAPEHRFMIQMRSQLRHAAFWPDAYSLDVIHPVVDFLALRKYPNSSAPTIDLRSTDKVGEEFRNPTNYSAGTKIAIITKAYGDKFSADMLKQEDKSLLWHEEFTDNEFANGHLLICTQQKEGKVASEFSNVTVLF